MDAVFTLAQWQTLTKLHHPDATLTLETGAGETYGEVGDWTAHVGSCNMYTVVGVWSPPCNTDYCWYLYQDEVYEAATQV